VGAIRGENVGGAEDAWTCSKRGCVQDIGETCGNGKGKSAVLKSGAVAPAGGKNMVLVGSCWGKESHRGGR